MCKEEIEELYERYKKGGSASMGKQAGIGRHNLNRKEMQWVSNTNAKGNYNC